MTPFEDSDEVVAARLRVARKMAGLSQGQIAKLLNLHRPTITDIEASRRRVKADELLKFADIYEVDISWLAGRGAERLD